MSDTSFGKVAVLLGGLSSERDVSLNSGQAIYESLIRQGVDAHKVDPAEDLIAQMGNVGFDRAFIALHGKYGEDGLIQGFLESIHLPYTGCDVLSSAVCMDKIFSKNIWSFHDLPTIPYTQINTVSDARKASEEYGYPLCIKPANEGSSVGVSKVKSFEQLEPAYLEAKKYDDCVIAEPWIEGRELSLAVMGDQAYSIVEIIPEGEFYDYNAKYVDKGTQYLCPCDLPEDVVVTVQQLALSAVKPLRCRGVVRVDLILDKQNQPWLLEVNTLPGMTNRSLVPMSMRDLGVDFDKLVIKILAETL